MQSRWMTHSCVMAYNDLAPGHHCMSGDYACFTPSFPPPPSLPPALSIHVFLLIRFRPSLQMTAVFLKAVFVIVSKTYLRESLLALFFSLSRPRLFINNPPSLATV